VSWEVVEVIGGAFGVILVLYQSAKVLITKYFEKADELEKEKARHREEIIEDIKTEIYLLRAKIEALETKVVEAMVKVKDNQEASRKVLASLERFVSDTEKRFKEIENSEVVKLGENAWMLRKKSL